jgi:hypothetical protein
LILFENKAQPGCATGIAPFSIPAAKAAFQPALALFPRTFIDQDPVYPVNRLRTVCNRLGGPRFNPKVLTKSLSTR